MSNSYITSTGERILKTVIDSRIRKAKAEVLDIQMRDYSYNFCEICQRSSGTRFDVSHIVSTDECQKSGFTEKAWQVSNLEVLCRNCHQRRDKLYLGF